MEQIRLYELQTYRIEPTVPGPIDCVHFIFLFMRLYNIVGGVGGGCFYLCLLQVRLTMRVY